MTDEIIATVFDKIKQLEKNVSEAKQKRSEYFKINKLYNDLPINSTLDPRSMLSCIFSEDKMHQELLKYELANVMPVDKYVLNENTINTDIPDKIKATIEHFTPVIFPVVEDKEWKLCRSSFPLFNFPADRILFLNTTSHVYDKFALTEFLEMLVKYLTNLIDTKHIKYIIKSDVNYKIYWAIISVRFI